MRLAKPRIIDEPILETIELIASRERCRVNGLELRFWQPCTFAAQQLLFVPGAGHDVVAAVEGGRACLDAVVIFGKSLRLVQGLTAAVGARPKIRKGGKPAMQGLDQSLGLHGGLMD